MTVLHTLSSLTVGQMKGESVAIAAAVEGSIAVVIGEDPENATVTTPTIWALQRRF